MPTAILEVATAEELRSIADRALTALEEQSLGNDDPVNERRSHVRFRVAVEALRFVSVAAAALGDASLMSVVLDALEELVHWNDDAPDNIETVCEGVTGLLAAGAAIDARVREFARTDDHRLRLAVASGLRPKTPPAVALLEELCRDPVPEVRQQARKRLGPVREVSWWTGKWKSDPIARLRPEEMAECAPAIEAISKLLDSRSYEISRHHEELVGNLEKLPDPLLIEVAENVLAGSERWWYPRPELGTLMLSRPGSEEALIRLFQHWGENAYFLGEQALSMFTRLPVERLHEICTTFLRRVATASDKERKEQSGLAATLARVVGQVWPKDVDLGPVLDVLLSLPVEEGHSLDWVSSGLDDVFEREVKATSVLDRVMDACVEEFPGSWDKLRYGLLKMLGRLPPQELRALVERILARPTGKMTQWAIEQLLGKAYDPERDPPVPEFLRQLYEDPRYRQCMRDSYELQPKLCPLLRLELRAGSLDFRQARTAISVLTRVYGGAERQDWMSLRYDREKEEEERRLKLREALAEFLGPEALQGPPTDEEWDLYRAARDEQGQAERSDWLLSLSLMPKGPWHPADRALFEAAVAEWRAGDDSVGYPLSLILTAKPTLEHLPLFDELIAREPLEDQGHLRYQKWHAMERLGIEPPEEGEDEDEGASPGEWMDEPEAD
jgi:hypothetical protein